MAGPDRRVRILGAQLNLTVGDLAGNEAKILAAMARAEASGADVVVLPELAISGYPPEDLLGSAGFVADQEAALARLAAASGRVVTIVGAAVSGPDPTGPAAGPGDSVARALTNAAVVLGGGRVLGVVAKQLLPAYGVFDEGRYFRPGPSSPRTFEVAGVVVGVVVCEDLWRLDVPAALVASAGVEVLVVLNASPYHQAKPAQREALVRARAAELGVAVVYLNCVGGQDELVFDGASLVSDATGTVVARAPLFAEADLVCELGFGPGYHAPTPPPPAPWPARLEETWRALVCALGDYVNKNGFPGVLLGLSGGIDSAVVAALATDALGPARVRGLSLPGPYSSPGSLTDAAELARRLGVRFEVVEISTAYRAALDAFAALDAPRPGQGPVGVSEENLQARLRGMALMAVSNKTGAMVLTTGNKSETAVGFCTLGGDTMGGFAPIRDVAKLVVYELARWRNGADAAALGLAGGAEPIPSATLTKPPSAELAPDQRDDQALPPYEVLDPILEAYVERAATPAQIVAAGFDPATVAWVVAQVDRNEYKRRQAPPGTKITPRAFGRDRRLPITNHYRPAPGSSPLGAHQPLPGAGAVPA